MARNVELDIIANNKASKSFNDAADSADKLSNKVGGALGSLVKFGAAAAGVAVAGGLVAVFKTGIDEQKDFLAGQAQLSAGIKSTGGAAKVSVDHLEDLASSIQNYSGQTDDSIVASEKLLLTFTNIRNEAGKNNDVFDQTVKISADMAARMGTDASASAIQLGKALNDPVKGITALTRVGVSFTQQQKDQIEKLQKSGDLLGAQKVILGELNKEFGGSAKAAGDTLPGQLARLKRSFEDVSQSVIQALMPVLLKAADFLTGTLMPAFNRLVQWIIANWPAIQKTIVNSWNNYIFPVLKAVAAGVMKYVVDPITLAVEWVVAHWPQIQQVLVLFWQTVKPVLVAFGNYLLTLWHSIIEPLVAWVRAHWDQISTALKVAAIIIGVAFKVLAVTITTYINIVAAVIRTVVPIIVAIIQTIIDIVQAVAAVITWLYNNVWKPQWDLIWAVVEGFIGFFTALPGRIAGAASTLFDGVKTAALAVKDFVGARVSDIVQFFIGLPTRISTFVSGAFDSVGQEMVGSVKWAINGMIGLLNRAAGFINDKLIGTANQIPFVNIPRIPPIPPVSFAQGGLITGPTLAMLGDNRTGRELAVPLDSSGGNAAVDKAIQNAFAKAGQFGGGDRVPAEFYLTVGQTRLLVRALDDSRTASSARRGG